MAPSRPAVYPDQVGLVIITAVVIIAALVVLVLALAG
jgi:hypothetical protein